MASVPLGQPRWYFSHSSTLRSIYVLRYFLFAGGTGVAGALIQLATTGVGRPLLGLLVGLAIGLIVFLGQMGNAFAPRLALSQRALYLVKYRRFSRVPWEDLREVVRNGDRLVLRLSVPARRNRSDADTEIQLIPRRLGTGAEELLQGLRALALDPVSRQRLPSDEDLRARIEKK